MRGVLGFLILETRESKWMEKGEQRADTGFDGDDVTTEILVAFAFRGLVSWRPCPCFLLFGDRQAGREAFVLFVY